MSRARSLLSDTVVLAFGTLTGRVLGLLLLPLYTYCLTRAEFGTVDLVVTSIDLILPLLYLSVSEAVLRFAMSPAERSGDVLLTALAYVCGASVFAVVVGLVLSFWLPSYVVLLVAILVTQCVTVVLGAWGRATGHVRAYATAGVFQAVGVGLSNVGFLVFLDMGVQGFLLSLLVGYVFGALWLVIKLPVVASLRGASIDRGLLVRMLLFSAPLVLNVILWWLTNISGRYFLAFGHGVDAVGIFAVASRFPALVVMVTTVFSQAWQLSANKSADAGEEGQGSFYSDVFRAYVAILCITVGSFVLVVKPLVRLATAGSFYEAWQAIPLLLFGAMFAAFASFYGAIYTAAKKSRGVLKTTLAAGVVSLALNAALVPPFGVEGAALSIALCFFGLWVIRVIDSQSIVRTSISPRLTLPALLVLAFQSGVQYSPIDATLAYVLMTGAWLLLFVLFRGELTVAFHLVRRRRGYVEPRHRGTRGSRRRWGSAL